MKSIFKITLLLCCALIVSNTAHSQRLLKRLKENAQKKIEQKVEERVEKKVDEKLDKEIDKGLDKLENSLEKKTDSAAVSNESDEPDRETKYQNRMQGLLKSAGISGDPVPYENNYNFNNLIQMHIESYSKEGEKTSDGEFITHLNPSTKSMAYEVVSGDMAKSEDGMFIMDGENGAMLILSEKDGKKNGIVYGMSSYMDMMGATYEEEMDLSETPETWMANPNVKKTGKTKTIAGLKCEEYIYTDETTKSNVWITKDMKLTTQDFFSTLFKTSMASHGMGWGYMMEATSVDTETGEKSIMTVTKVDKNSNKNFNLSSYQITNLGSFTIPTESK